MMATKLDLLERRPVAHKVKLQLLETELEKYKPKGVLANDAAEDPDASASSPLNAGKEKKGL